MPYHRHMTFTLKPRPAKSLAHAVRRAIVQAVLMTACLAGSYAVSSMVQDPTLVFPEAGPAAPVQVDQEAVKAQDLVERHGCWTGEPPADMVGEFPGHVVTQHGYQGEKAVAQALGQVFDGEDHGLRVFAFCR